MRSLAIAPAVSEEELAAVAAIGAATTPEDPGTVQEMRWDDERYGRTGRFLARLDDLPVGTASAGRVYVHPPEFDALWTTIRVLERYRCRGIGTALLGAVSGHARLVGKSTLQVPVRDSRPEALAFFAHRGFVEIERSRVVRLELDGLATPPAGPPAGVTLTTLAERPDLIRAVHALAVKVFPDVPGASDMEAGPFEEWRARDADPELVPHHGFALALVGMEVVGYASVILPPGRPGIGFHDMTVVDRDWRGRGVAGALKHATLAWAVATGLAALEAQNNIDNAPMRAINSRLGYRPVADRVMLRGPLASA